MGGIRGDRLFSPRADQADRVVVCSQAEDAARARRFPFLGLARRCTFLPALWRDHQRAHRPGFCRSAWRGEVPAGMPDGGLSVSADRVDGIGMPVSGSRRRRTTARSRAGKILPEPRAPGFTPTGATGIAAKKWPPDAASRSAAGTATSLRPRRGWRGLFSAVRRRAVHDHSRGEIAVTEAQVGLPELRHQLIDLVAEDAPRRRDQRRDAVARP